MSVEPEVFADAARLGAGAAARSADELVAARRAGRSFLLGCPGGRSASSTYQALAVLVAERRLDLGHVVVVMMDDYVIRIADGTLDHEDVHALHSCVRFGQEEIVRPLSAAAGPGRGVPAANLWLPDARCPAAYDARIADAGGVDVFLLASGAGDGHVAFNAPGTPADSRTRIVDLPDSTRRDNLATFPSFGQRLDRVPRYGVTVGIDTIVAHSASVLMLAHGADKATAAQHLMAADGYDPGWPATVFAGCSRPRLFLDQAALAAAPATSAR